MSEVAVSAFATLQALVRSRSCLRMEFDFPKLFGASARFANGCLKLGLPMCGSIRVPSTASKSNSLGDVPTNTASLCLRSIVSRHNPDDLFEQAQSAEELGDIAEAERLYRILMKSDPMDASASFNLGNMLRAHARNVEAEAALRAATRVDPTFAEAWYNLGDLLDEEGRCEAGIECLRKALQVAPDYAA